MLRSAALRQCPRRGFTGAKTANPKVIQASHDRPYVHLLLSPILLMDGDASEWRDNRQRGF